MSHSAFPTTGSTAVQGFAPTTTGSVSLFALREPSNTEGAPVILYEFVRGSVTWRYTSADQNVIFGGNTYTAVPISDQGVTQSGDVESDEFIIQAPFDLDPVSLYVTVPPAERVRVLVRRHHLGDQDAPVMFAGTMNRVRRTNALSADVICRTLAGVLRKGGLRLTWQRNCPFVLYGPDCKVNKNSHRIGDTVTALNGSAIILPAAANFPGNHFQGGFVEWTVQAGVVGRRGITQHGGTFIELLGGSQGISVGTFVYAYSGCARTREYCNGVFNNLSNYGGIAHLPDRSPFDGNPVF